MRIHNFIIGLMFFIACSIITLTFVFDMYGPEGYDIDLDANNDTAFLQSIKDNAILAQADSDKAREGIWNKTTGQYDMQFEAGQTDEGSMIASSLSALRSVGSYMDIFVIMIEETFGAMGINTKGALMWFLVSSLIIVIGMLLIGSVLRNFI